jgi:hypothetical protein
MSDKDVVLSEDLQAQIQKLDGMEDLLQKYMRPAMRESVSLLSDAVEPNIPTLTGYAREKFGTHVLGSGLNLTGYVGWKGSPTAWWMNIVENGARQHDLTKGESRRSRGGAERFATLQKFGFQPSYRHMLIDGQWKSMNIHPGFAGRFLLSNALEGNQEAVESIFSGAAENFLGELAINA